MEADIQPGNGAPLKEHQRDFMPEDTKAGMIQAFLDSYPGDTVCSKQLYKEALNHDFDEPKQWEIREINEIMNQCVTGWNYFSNPRMFAGYGRQKGWERENARTEPATDSGNGTEKSRRDLRRCRNRWSFHSEKSGQGQPVAHSVAIPLPTRLPGKIP